MSYYAKFTGWKNLTLSDLLIAYRKAKVDCFFEKGFPSATQFALYEKNLLNNLSKLLEELKVVSDFKELTNIFGEFRLTPKKLVFREKEEGQKNGHIHFSNPQRAFKHLTDYQNLIPEFRIVGDFPVKTHVISALWINMVGYKFDVCLGSHAYGSRLKIIRNTQTCDVQPEKSFHIKAIGSFEPYFEPYQKWRNDGLNAIRTELEQKRQVLAISLDLKSYYHQIDPLFIANEEFQKDLGLSLTECEKLFTRQLANFLSEWSEQSSIFANSLQIEQTEKVKKYIKGGLVIGLSASRVIANVLLHKWDKLIAEKLTPVYYGRYVDDMFLVLHDPTTVCNTETLIQLFTSRFENVFARSKTDPALWEINLGDQYQAGSKIQFQDGKQKLFVLEGQAGCDLLDSIEKEIRDLSSEHRLMPSPDQLEHTTAARVLSAAGKVGDEPDTMRRADGLTIRRLGWSLQLRHVETLAHDLPLNEWQKEREEFYQFAHNHILRADKIIEHYAYIPRLLGFAIGLKEWQQAIDIAKTTFNAFDLLAKHSQKQIVVNGVECNIESDEWLSRVHDSLALAFFDMAARCYPIDMCFKEPNEKVECLSTLLSSKLPYTDELNSWGFHCETKRVAQADLAKKPYKNLADVLVGHIDLDNTKDNELKEAFETTELLLLEDLMDFLESAKNKRFPNVQDKSKIAESISPFLFPTRPYTPEEIAELVPDCIGFGLGNDNNVERWAKYVSVLRGVWVKSIVLNGQSNKSAKKQIHIGTNKSRSVLVAITNIATSEESWAATAFNKPDLTKARYLRLVEIVNQAIQLVPRPEYLILPELSLPLAWVHSVANRLLNSGISLIAGTEYRHNNQMIHSEAYLALTDDRLGYSSSVRIWQPKLEPAVGEDEKLTRIFGKAWTEFKGEEFNKPVYNHNGFHFGVMVCSELQNSKARVDFQGEVDALLVLSWNPDLETFSALIEACALDVHAYTILVNNRTYGDSRVRSPAKKNFKRDLARVRGGQNDFCVAVELDLEKLRAFQSRAKRWPTEDDPFKPLPEGFKPSDSRKIRPK